MSYASQLAKRFREVLLSGKWVTNTNLQEQLANVTLSEANTSLTNLNSIAALTFHINYYIEGVNAVFEGGALTIRDRYSFDLPSLTTAEQWADLKARLFANAERFASHVEQLSDEQLQATFVDEKYGNYLRNIDGLIEHAYYHLGQIVLIRKLLAQQEMT